MHRIQFFSPWFRPDLPELPQQWREILAPLAQQRASAEICAGLLRSYGEDATNRESRAFLDGLLAYGEAKAEFDGIIAALDVALAEGKQPSSVSDLQSSLQRGSAKRQAFCKSVLSLVSEASSQQSDQTLAIWEKFRSDNALVRVMIRNQLRSTAWLPFADINPLHP
jgi:hypothetical protein